MKFKLFIAFVSAMAISSLSSAASLVIDASGLLHGAHNVTVGGSLYDVDFRTGSYDQVFGVTSNFYGEYLASLMAVALLDQVMIDEPNSLYNQFDSHPGQIFGCTAQTIYTNDSCAALTVTAILPSYAYPDPTVGVEIASNSGVNHLGCCGDFAPGYSARAISSTPKSGGSGEINIWAVWTPAAIDSPAAVPTPAAAWLLGSGLLGLIGISRRKAA